jgi:hypothetical protein
MPQLSLEHKALLAIPGRKVLKEWPAILVLKVHKALLVHKAL